MIIKMKFKFVALFLVFSGIVLSLASNSQKLHLDSSFVDSSKREETPTIPVKTKTTTAKFLSSDELTLSYSILIFATIVLLLEVFLISINKVSPENSFKFITVTLIVSSSLFLITAGYDNNQIAPAFGLFGTVAGYILGKTNSPDLKKNQDEKETD